MDVWLASLYFNTKHRWMFQLLRGSCVGVYVCLPVASESKSNLTMALLDPVGILDPSALLRRVSVEICTKWIRSLYEPTSYRWFNCFKGGMRDYSMCRVDPWFNCFKGGMRLCVFLKHLSLTRMGESHCFKGGMREFSVCFLNHQTLRRGGEVRNE